MPAIGTLARLWRYPVKSMGGESLTSAEVTEHGLFGDRGWALRDEASGQITDGKKIPRLMACDARYLEEPTAATLGHPPPVAIQLPTGQVLRSDNPMVDTQLSEYCGRSVALVRRSLSQHFFDVHALHILTSGTIAALQATTPESTFAAERFRPNLLLDSETSLVGNAHSWCGRSLAMGALTMSLVMPTERCSMVMRAQRHIVEDAEVLRAVVRSGNLIGVYAAVAGSGTLRIGQELTDGGSA